jgi:cell volume regulation protein A
MQTVVGGSDGPGGISFDDPRIAKFLGAVALSFILFSGGLETKWNDIKPVFWTNTAVSTETKVSSTIEKTLTSSLVFIEVLQLS